jgi:hypothetical protein
MSNVKLFENQKIRSLWIEAEQKWYFSVADVVGGLTDSVDAKAYWRQLKRRKPQLVTDCHGFKLAAARMRALYQAKGYSPEWIEKRVHGIAVRVFNHFADVGKMARMDY